MKIYLFDTTQMDNTPRQNILEQLCLKKLLILPRRHCMNLFKLSVKSPILFTSSCHKFIIINHHTPSFRKANTLYPIDVIGRLGRPLWVRPFLILQVWWWKNCLRNYIFLLKNLHGYLTSPATIIWAVSLPQKVPYHSVAPLTTNRIMVKLF